MVQGQNLLEVVLERPLVLLLLQTPLKAVPGSLLLGLL
jgi:hypothetical protein